MVRVEKWNTNWPPRIRRTLRFKPWANGHLTTQWEVVYTMDCEVVPGLYKICNWLLNSSRNHFSLHQGKKNARVIMKFEVPKIYILRPALAWSNGFSSGNDKRGALVEKGKGPYHRNIPMIFFNERLLEEKMKTREWSNLIPPPLQNCPFWAYIY